jgi:hypothetical protein
MRRVVLGFGILLLFASTSRAQFGNIGGLGADPFSLYYGFYLPNQAYQASQPRIEDTINSVASLRQYNGRAQQAGVFDDMGGFGGADEDDMFRPYGGRGGMGRMRPLLPGSDTNAIRGLGPSIYYNRLSRYYPRMAAIQGRGPNRNVVQLRSRRGGGMGGMPGMGPR